MGANTSQDMQTISEMSNNLGVEVGFVGVVGEDREKRLGALTPDGENKPNGISIAGFQNQMSKAGVSGSSVFLWGHTHPEKGFEVNYANFPAMLSTDPANREVITASPSGYLFPDQGTKDYYQMLGRTTPAMVVTSKSVSIYSSNGNAGGNYNTHKLKSFRSK